MAQTTTSSQPLDLLVIGAGFSGMCISILAREAGFSVRMLEKGPDVGGVWRENTYPGAACDVPWYLYSFSFFKDVVFSRPYPQQAEILQYQKDCARHYKLYDCSEFGVEVAASEWNDESALWTVTTTAGDSYQARSLISSVGVLSRPSWPNIEGLDSFKGECFHSAQWDHSVDLKGKRVGVVGTGASAIQFIPEVAKEAGDLTVFQRSAPYVLPRFDDPYSRLRLSMHGKMPWTTLPQRYGVWKFGEALSRTFDGSNLVSSAVEKACAAIRRQRIADPELRAKLTPDYVPGCKRVLFTSNYYPTFARENVHLQTDGIARINPGGIEDKQGVQHDFDVLIMGTGFKATEFLAPMSIRGRGGLDLHESWKPVPAAHLGMTVPGFPNFFMMYGPNTNLGGNSIIFMIECQARYIVQALQQLREHRALEVTPQAFERYNKELRERLSKMVWATGCKSWYQTDDGHNPTNWPGPTAEYRRRTARLATEDFQFS